MYDKKFIDKFKEWLNYPNDNDIGIDYEPPEPDEVGLKQGAPDYAIKAYEEFKISYKDAKERGERL